MLLGSVRYQTSRLPFAAAFRSFHNSSHTDNVDYRSKIFQISDEVLQGVNELKPVVALETTIYTHGFPYPENVDLAIHLEKVVRECGGIPATIGVLNGVARVGLGTDELIELASAAGKKETMKISRRDIPYVTGLGIAGKKIHGGTTIAGSMFLANLAGIRIFGTGGLGGVHRGGEVTMDVSADLTELGRTPVAVISSGCKSFLDIPRTLEYLETQGVCVSTFADGRTGEIDLPAFWTRESGVKSPFIVQDEKEAAAIIYARGLLNLHSGLFFANPIPEEHSLPKSDIDQAIDEAVQDAERQGVHGHANTPFILDRIKQLTEGRSITANRALIEWNLARATKVAAEYSHLVSDGQTRTAHMPGIYNFPVVRRMESRANPDLKVKPDIVVAGSVAIDLSCDYAPLDPNGSTSVVAHTSNPAVIRQSVGGVGHNIATAAHLVGNDITVRLCSVVADDLAAQVILSSLEQKGLDTSSIIVLDQKSSIPLQTAQYVAINDSNKELAMAVADMRIISSPMDDFTPWETTINISRPKWIVVDTNWSTLALFRWIIEAKKAGASVAIEPVSVEKSKRLFPPKSTGEPYEKKDVYPNHDVDLITPNEHELSAIHSAAQENAYLERQDWWKVIDALDISSFGITTQLRKLTSPELVNDGIPQRMIQLLPFIPNIITKIGARGVVLAKLLPPNDSLLRSPNSAPYILTRNLSDHSDVGGVYLRHFPAAESVSVEDVVSVNGVGDTFLGVLIAGLAKEMLLEDVIGIAQRAAVMTLKSEEAVSPEVASLGVELEG